MPTSLGVLATWLPIFLLRIASRSIKRLSKKENFILIFLNIIREKGSKIQTTTPLVYILSTTTTGTSGIAPPEVKLEPNDGPVGQLAPTLLPTNFTATIHPPHPGFGVYSSIREGKHRLGPHHQEP
jgi:hypothetical protein